jgi:hypothetical protein
MLKILRSLFTSDQAKSGGSIPIEFPQYTQQAIRLITESHGQLEDKQLLSLFERNGIPPKEAVELLLFLPQAFCRRLLSEVKWPDYYLEYISEEKSIKRFYADNERYTVILAALQTYIAGEFLQSDYYKIAGRSASFHSLNQLLLDNPGRKLAEAIVTPETIIY